MVLTEPLPSKHVDPFNTFVSVEPYPDSLDNADIVILACPSYALEPFLIQNFSILREDCIMVDITNPIKDKRDLKDAIGALNITTDRWVKALNDTGAVQEMQHQAASKTELKTSVCGPNDGCVNEIIDLVTELGYTARAVPIDQYEELRGSQETIGWEWVHATLFMTVLFFLTAVYVIVQVSGRRNFQWYTLLARHSSKMFAWTAGYGFAFSLLPGTMIRLFRQLGCCSSSTPRILVWGCSIRKHSGLLSLYFLFLHACLMLIIFGGEYFGFLLREGKMEWNDEASMLTATLSTSLFVITGIASLPSVGHAMNKAQFMLVFGPVVWAALGLGVMHIMFLGVPSWTATPRSHYSWTRGMPPVTLMASVFPLLVMFTKALQLCLSMMIAAKDSFASRPTASRIHASDHLFDLEEGDL
jgi:hypothetical protein